MITELPDSAICMDKLPGAYMFFKDAPPGASPRIKAPVALQVTDATLSVQEGRREGWLAARVPEVELLGLPCFLPVWSYSISCIW